MESQGSFKELYDVALKTTYPVEMNGKTFEAGEVIAFFDRIIMANLTEQRAYKTANGGFDNRTLVTWDTTKQVDLQFTQGVFSKSQFAIMSNSHLITFNDVELSFREVKDADGEGIFTLDKGYTPLSIFLYNAETGEKLKVVNIDTYKYDVKTPYLSVIADYTANYVNGGSVAIIGKQLTSGYLSLEGKTRVKDDVTGRTNTGVIKIPRLQLMSELSMSLGRNANPLVATINAIAYPTGTRGNEKALEFFFLNDDIDSDM